MKTKVCSKCKEEIPFPDGFHKNRASKSGYVFCCKECNKAAAREWSILNRSRFRAYKRQYDKDNREKHSQYTIKCRTRYPERYRCRNITTRAIIKGNLILGPCVECGTTEDLHAHHEDYSKPLEVTPLCGTHHRQLHAERQRI